MIPFPSGVPPCRKMRRVPLPLRSLSMASAARRAPSHCLPTAGRAVAAGRGALQRAWAAVAQSVVSRTAAERAASREAFLLLEALALRQARAMRARWEIVRAARQTAERAERTLVAGQGAAVPQAQAQAQAQAEGARPSSAQRRPWAGTRGTPTTATGSTKPSSRA